MVRGALYYNTNKDHTGGGIEAALVRYPVSSKIKLTQQLIVQQQPKKLSFYERMETAADARLKADWEVFDNGELFAEAGYKTAGWTPGTVYLTEQSLFRAGSIGIQFGLCVVIGVLGGYWLDEKFATKPWLLTVGMMFGVAAAIRSMVREIKIWQDKYGAEEPDEEGSE
ncbi:hypothetical protein CHS0354_018541 [Potamilus streckersoni]|uniref:AtpZ/AtpI family protein n=1 Tax=Potamilus streckersoni TaxID=2493646 RepID=A0AAE0WB42_9BIVA|nr:hypothetical protein CHS0354_018541 [Potamilus streckersoni]